MKVGDLVTLSARGSKLKSYEDIKSKVGIITRINGWCYSVVCEAGKLTATHLRHDLKMAKVSK